MGKLSELLLEKDDLSGDELQLARGLLDQLEALAARLGGSGAQLLVRQPSTFMRNLELRGARPEIMLANGDVIRKAHFANYASGSYQTTNAYYDGANWNLDDPDNAGMILNGGTNLALQLRGVSAGANPRTPVEYLRVDNATGALGIKDGITAPTAVSGVAFLYVDTADGDLKVRFGDGTTKVIAADT